MKLSYFRLLLSILICSFTAIHFIPDAHIIDGAGNTIIAQPYAAIALGLPWLIFGLLCLDATFFNGCHITHIIDIATNGIVGETDE